LNVCCLDGIILMDAAPQGQLRVTLAPWQVRIFMMPSVNMP
jgi:hypothetical protein